MTTTIQVTPGGGTATITTEELRHYSDGDSIAISTQVVVWGTWKTHGNLPALIYFGQDRKSPAAEGRPMVVGMSGGMVAGLRADGSKVFWGGPATRFWAAPDMTAGSNQQPVADWEPRADSGRVELTGAERAEADAAFDSRDQAKEYSEQDVKAWADENRGKSQSTADAMKPMRTTEHPHGADKSSGADALVASSQGKLRTVKEIAATAAKPGQVPSASRRRGDRSGQSGQSCLCGCNQVARLDSLYLQGHDARHASQVAKAILADPDADPIALLAALPTEKLRIKAAAIVAKRLPTGSKS